MQENGVKVSKYPLSTYGSERDGPVPSHSLMNPIIRNKAGQGMSYEPKVCRIISQEKVLKSSLPLGVSRWRRCSGMGIIAVTAAVRSPDVDASKLLL